MTSLGMHMWWNFCYVLRYEGKSAQCPGKGFLVLKREGFALFLSSWTLYHYKGVVWSWSFGSHLGIQKDLSTKGWLCRKKGIVWPWMMLTNLTTLPPLPSAFFIWGNTIPFLFFFFHWKHSKCYTSFLFLKPFKLLLISGLFPLSGTLFPQMFTWLSPSNHSGLSSNFTFPERLSMNYPI